MEKQKNLILIDGHALAFRQYYALERTGMRNSSGVPSWAVFGFFKAIFDLLKNETFKADAIAVTFDVSHHTFRTAEFTEYKANREKMPDDMQVQMGLIFEGLEAFNIPIYKKEGFEADDVIGTISKKACELGHKVYILTGDQDAFQLVDQKGCVKVVIPSKGELVEYDWDKVYEKWGVYPNQVIDYKALRGDTSDNIPGIKGIGEKTAQKLLSRFGNLDNIYASIEEIKENAVREKIINGKDVAYMSQFLATIVREVEVDFDFDKACINMPDLASVTAFLTKMQLFSFLKNINNILGLFNRGDNNCGCHQVVDAQLENTSIEVDKLFINEDKLVKCVINTKADIDDLVAKINTKKSFFFTLDAYGDNLLKQNISSVCIAVIDVKDGDKFTFNLSAEDNIDAYYISGEKFIDAPLLKELFESVDIAKFTVDCKRDFNILKSNGIELNNVVFDVVLASYIDNPANNHDIEVQALQYLNITPANGTEGGQNVVQLGLLDLVDDSVKCLHDLWLLIVLSAFHCVKLTESSWKLLKEIEIPIAKVLADMEYTGVAVDVKELTALTQFLNSQISDLEVKIFEIAGCEFNLNSPKQVGEILFDKLGLQHKKRSKGKTSYSTSAEVLEKLAEEHEIARLILEYRKFAKLKSTYTDALPALINSIDNRIHTTYNQTLTVTGRLSSSNPNLQNIPTRTDVGEKIREAFVAQEKGNLILSADYSQIELRLLAHISGDKELCNSFINNTDVHAVTASKIFDVPLDEVTKQMRSRAKAVNFGIVYGQSKYGLAKAVGITNDEADEFIRKYFETYPSIKAYMSKMVMFVEKEFFAETIFGRKRYFQNEINSSNAMVREFAKRAAINFPMQGSAADLMKLAMIKFYCALKENNLKSKMIMQVHDEIVVEVVDGELDIVKKLVQESMELGQPLTVPLLVNIEVGEHW